MAQRRYDSLFLGKKTLEDVQKRKPGQVISYFFLRDDNISYITRMIDTRLIQEGVDNERIKKINTLIKPDMIAFANDYRNYREARPVIGVYSFIEHLSNINRLFISRTYDSYSDRIEDMINIQEQPKEISYYKGYTIHDEPRRINTSGACFRNTDPKNRTMGLADESINGIQNSDLDPNIINNWEQYCLYDQNANKYVDFERETMNYQEAPRRIIPHVSEDPFIKWSFPYSGNFSYWNKLNNIHYLGIDKQDMDQLPSGDKFNETPIYKYNNSNLYDKNKNSSYDCPGHGARCQMDQLQPLYYDDYNFAMKPSKDYNPYASILEEDEAKNDDHDTLPNHAIA